MSYNFDPAQFAGMTADNVRREIGDQIDRMLDYLDSLEGDSDLEDGHDDEESLGWTISHGACTAHSYISMPKAWCDLEGDEHDGREPDVCGESWLGWTEAINQENGQHREGGGWGVSADYEADPAESGIGDRDGLLEQVGCKIGMEMAI